MKWLGVSAEYVMDHPVEAVWEFVSNEENNERWVNGVLAPRWTSDGERAVGSTYESRYEYAGKTHDVEYEVTAYDPPSVFGSRTTSGPFPYAGTIKIQAVDGGTKVTHEMMAGSDGAFTEFMFTALGWLLRPMMRKRVRKEIETMGEEIRKDANG